jgi:protocatechuate 4,5-dioxygenase alpha chain
MAQPEGGDRLIAYALNKALYELHDPANREAFKTDRGAYLDRYHLTDEERRAVLDLDWKRMNELGASVYVMTKLGAVVGVTLYQMGAHMRGMSFEQYQRFVSEQEGRAAPYALLPKTAEGVSG